jgi:hypothetical protein
MIGPSFGSKMAATGKQNKSKNLLSVLMSVRQRAGLAAAILQEVGAIAAPETKRFIVNGQQRGARGWTSPYGACSPGQTLRIVRWPQINWWFLTSRFADETQMN